MTLQNLGIAVAAATGVATLILTSIRFVQEQIDRRRKSRTERRQGVRDALYERWVSGYEKVLVSSDEHLLLDVPPRFHRLASRAVREGHLAWSGWANKVTLPRRNIDA
jgi:hypothetical protein